MQAEYFRVQSKYMVLLQEAQNPRIGKKQLYHAHNLELVIIMSGGSPGITLLHSTCSLMCQWNVEIMNVEYIPLLDYNNIIIIHILYFV